MKNIVVKYLLIFLGFLSLGLGVLGIFLPLLPTTPFLLLSAILFANSSQKINNWLLNHRIFGEYIRSFLKDKSIPLRVKVLSVAILWITISFSVFFIIADKTWLQILLLVVAVCVTVHILHYKTKK